MVGALADAATDWPVGATAVKESYRGEELALIAAMERGDERDGSSRNGPPRAR